MNLQCTVLMFCMAVVLVGGTGTYFLPDLRTESGSTVFNMALRAGIAIPFQVSDLSSQEPGVLYLRPGDVYAFSFPSQLRNNAILEMHMGVTVKPCRFQITDATGEVMMDLNWVTDEFNSAEARYTSMSNMMLPLAGFDTSKFFLKVLDYPTWPQWREEYFTFLGTLVSAWETDTTEASEQVTVIKMSEDHNIDSLCFVDDTFRLGPTRFGQYQGFPSTLPTKYFVANVSSCKLNLSSSLAIHQGPLANSTYIEFNGFRLQGEKGELTLKDEANTDLYTMTSANEEEEMMAMTFRVPTQWLQQISGYYLELQKVFLSPYIKLKGSGPRSRVMNLTDATISGNMVIDGTLPALEDDYYQASRVSYENSLGGQLTFQGHCRRRRSAPEQEQTGKLSFKLEAADLIDRPFMSILWWIPEGTFNWYVSLTDSAGKHFLKYEYTGFGDAYGPSWETTFSLMGVSPGEINLTIHQGDFYQFDPLFTLFKLPGVPTKISDYNMSCPVPSSSPTHGGLGTYYLPNIQTALGSTQFCMVARGGVSFPYQMSDLTTQDPGVLFMLPGDVYAFEFPMLLANTLVLELNLGNSGKASRFQVTDGSDSLMVDLNWLQIVQDTFGTSTMMIPLAGFNTSKFHVKVLDYPGWSKWSSQYFSFLGTLVSVWDMDTTEASEQVTLIKLPEQHNIDCIVDATFVSSGSRNGDIVGVDSLLPARYFVANASTGTCSYNLSSSLASFGTAMMESTYLEFNGFKVEVQRMKVRIKSADNAKLYELAADRVDSELSPFSFKVPTTWLRNASAAGYYMTLSNAYLSPFIKLKGNGHRSKVIDLFRSATLTGTMVKKTTDRLNCEGSCAEFTDPLGSGTLAGEMRRRRSPDIPKGVVTFRLEEEDVGDSTFMEIDWLQAHAKFAMKVWLSDSAGNKFLKTEHTKCEEDAGPTYKTIVSLLGVAPGEVNLTVTEDSGYQLYPFITLFRLNYTTSTTTTHTTATTTTGTTTTGTTTTDTATTSTRTTATATATTATATTTTATATTTTLPTSLAPGDMIHVIATSMSVTTTNCTEAKRMVSSPHFCDALAISMAGLLRLHTRYVSSTCSVAGSCNRRLFVLPNSWERQLAGLPVVKVDYRIHAPTSQSSSMMVSLTSVAPSALESLITGSLVGTVFQGSVNSVTVLSQPTTSVSFVGFECYLEQGCFFNSYEIGNHYKTTAFNWTECAKACYADQACEAFESLSGNNVPHECAFWMHGACNIETVGSKAPGFVSGYSGLLFCDKNTSRKPLAVSNSHMLGLRSVICIVILLVCISGEP